jgi:hypothetical protein
MPCNYHIFGCFVYRYEREMAAWKADQPQSTAKKAKVEA